MAAVDTSRRGERLPWRTLLAYSAPASAFSFYLFFTQFYFLKFATDVLLAGPAVMGLIFGAGRLWGAVSDPMVGHWSDRTRRPSGRRRPWMFAGIPLLAVFFAMLWIPPRELTGGWLMTWSALALFGFYSAFTIYSIPHASLGVELTDDYHGRTSVFGAQRMAFVAGMMLAFGAIGYSANAVDPRGSVALIVGLTTALASFVLLLAPLQLRERPVRRARRAEGPFRALRGVLANPHARLVLGVWFVEGFSGGVLGVLAPYVGEYVVRRPDLIAVIPAFFVVSGVVAIPVWVDLSRRFGKQRIWSFALLGVAVFFAASFFVGARQIPLLCALLAGAGACSSAGGAIGQSMLADAIDYDELQTGERKEGAYMAAWGFALKLSLGLTIVLMGIALETMGFQPNVEQTPRAELALRVLFSGAPFASALVAFSLLRRAALDEGEHARVLAALEVRACERARG